MVVPHPCGEGDPSDALIFEPSYDGLRSPVAPVVRDDAGEHHDPLFLCRFNACGRAKRCLEATSIRT